MVWIKHLSGLLKGLRWFVESTKVLSRRIPQRSPSSWAEQPFLLAQNAPLLGRNFSFSQGNRRTQITVLQDARIHLEVPRFKPPRFPVPFELGQSVVLRSIKTQD